MAHKKISWVLLQWRSSQFVIGKKTVGLTIVRRIDSLRFNPSPVVHDPSRVRIPQSVGVRTVFRVDCPPC